MYVNRCICLCTISKLSRGYNESMPAVRFSPSGVARCFINIAYNAVGMCHTQHGTISVCVCVYNKSGKNRKCSKKIYVETILVPYYNIRRPNYHQSDSLLYTYTHTHSSRAYNIYLAQYRKSWLNGNLCVRSKVAG